MQIINFHKEQTKIEIQEKEKEEKKNFINKMKYIYKEFFNPSQDDFVNEHPIDHFID